MPYVVCPRCAARSYVPLRAPAEPCPVCGGELRARPRPVDEADSRSDTELTARHRAGDHRAFELLHARHALPLRAHARRLIGAGPAEDAVQDTFERAHRFLLHDPRAGDPGFQIGPWLHTVVHHRCVDELRRAGRATLVDVATLVSPAPGPCDQVVQRDQIERLSLAVADLPERQRVALVAHVLGGEPHEQVARRLRVSVGASKNLVNRARVELRHLAA